MFGLGSLLGGGGGGGSSLQTSTTQTLDTKLTQGPVSFGSNNVGRGAGGGNSLLYVLIAAGVVALAWIIKK